MEVGRLEHVFDSSVPEPGRLAGLSDAELIDAAAATTRAENAACARKLAIMAELFIRRTGLPPDERELWWVDPEAAVSAEIAAAHNITSGLALHQTHRGVALRDRLPKVAALFFAGLISDLLVREIVSRTYLVDRPDLMAALDADLAAEILGWGPLSVKKTRTHIDDLVERHDPGALRKARASENQRSVSFGNPTDAPGFTSVNAVMFNCDAATAERNLTQMVYGVCDSDPRTVEERRNDAFAAIQAGLTALACQCGADDCEAATRPTPLRDTTIFVLTDATTPAEDKAEAEVAPKPKRRQSAPCPPRRGRATSSAPGSCPRPYYRACSTARSSARSSTLVEPTATLWTGDPPRTEPSDRRGKQMPRRRNTRAYNRRRAIAAERKLNDPLVAERNKPPPL